MKKVFNLRNLLLIFVLTTESLNGWAQSMWTNPITGTNPNTANPYTIGAKLILMKKDLGI